MMKKNIVTDLTDFPQRTQINLAWGEMDSYLHINNSVYFRYFETARIESFAKVGTMESMEQNKIGPILAETSCKFIRPITFPDTIEVGVKSMLVDEFSYEQDYAIFSQMLKRIVAIGSARIVFFDYQAQQKTKIPLEIVKFIPKS